MTEVLSKDPSSEGNTVHAQKNYKYLENQQANSYHEEDTEVSHNQVPKSEARPE